MTHRLPFFLLAGLLAGCAGIPGLLDERTWIGRPLQDAQTRFGKAQKVEPIPDGGAVHDWVFDSYRDRVVPTGMVQGYDAGGRPVLYPTSAVERVHYACRLRLTANNEGVVVGSNIRPVAGVGPLLAGGCSGHDLGAK